jgi:DNA-binding helix-hairpin-helix protein with protein kinase domain
MVDHRPTENAWGHKALAWPKDLLLDEDDGSVVGCVLPRAREAVALSVALDPLARRRVMRKWTYRHSICLSLNLCHAFSLGHQIPGYVFGDPNSENVMFDRSCQVTITDMDSGQIHTGKRVFECQMTTVNYSAPEVLISNSTLRSVQQDYFALAVMLFELLCDGQHPFAGRVRGNGKAMGIAARVKANYFPYRRSWLPPIRRPRIDPPDGDVFFGLSRSLRRLFTDTFRRGHREPKRRATPQQYAEALQEFETNLVPCRTNPLHEHERHKLICPWCWRNKSVGFDSFAL